MTGWLGERSNASVQELQSSVGHGAALEGVIVEGDAGPLIQSPDSLETAIQTRMKVLLEPSGRGGKRHDPGLEGERSGPVWWASTWPPTGRSARSLNPSGASGDPGLLAWIVSTGPLGVGGQVPLNGPNRGAFQQWDTPVFIGYYPLAPFRARPPADYFVEELAFRKCCR